MAGFPTKFTESISCGTPVITNKTSDIEDYLIDGMNGFFLTMQLENDIKVMKRIVSLEKSEILTMKKYCNESKVFSYINFKSSAKRFIGEVLR
jgi:glycosyltransferase involved in cell wall biosynthesis